MTDLFDFLYDDAGLSPARKLTDAISAHVGSFQESAASAFHSPLGKAMKVAGGAGLVVGAGIGGAILVTGMARAVVSLISPRS